MSTTTEPSTRVMAGLVADRALLDRTSTAERVADILRARISAGYFPPGARLAEEQITEALGVSRNTLREAFRLLTHERLLVHQLNRGVFVRVLDLEDITDLYRVRTYLECAVVRAIITPVETTSLTEAIEQGERALAENDWRALGTADLQFHRAIAALAGSARINELMDRTLAELRLVFALMDDPRRFHEPYLQRHREIRAALAEGRTQCAEQLLRDYLQDARQQLLEAYTARRIQNPDQAGHAGCQACGS